MRQSSKTNKKYMPPPNWADILDAHRCGDFDAVAVGCNSILKVTPHNAAAWNMLGVIALARKEFSQATEFFGKARSCDQNNPALHNNYGVAAKGCGKLKDAEKAYRHAIQLRSDYPDAWFNLGNILRDQGDERSAVDAFRQATALKPDYHAAWNNLGNTLRGMGKADEAADAYRNALLLRDDPQTRSNMASALREAGEADAALAMLRDAVLIQPNNPALQFNLANALRDADCADEAIDHYRHALALKPDYDGAANNLGTLWLKRGEALAALECYCRAVFLAPDNTDYLANCANAERALKRYERAIVTIRQAIALKPDFAAYYFNLANYLREWQQYDPTAVIENEEIKACYRQAIALKPDFSDAWNNLAGFLSDNGRDEEALDAYQRALDLSPDNWQYHFSMAQRLHSTGDIDAARVGFRAGLALKEHAGARIRYETLFPAIMESEAGVAETRIQLAGKLEELKRQNLTIDDPMRDIAVAPMFYLAYHGECNADLMRGYADLIRAACPSVEYVAPHCCESRPPAKKIRIGFASKFLQAHTIGRFFRGILKNLNRCHFDIFAFMPPAKQDDVTRWIASHVDHFEVLPPTLDEARQRIADHRLDILVYADLGMEPFTYYLAFSRLASTQCVLYGHPDTTGIPTIDYFLSGGACESLTAESHYTEKLVRLDPNSTYTYYYRPENRAAQKSRSDLGLPEAAHLYTCAQSMFKIHPEMDPVFDAILERDPKGRLLLFDDVSQRRIALFKTRLQKRMRHFDRVTFLPRIQLPEFLQVLHLSDALLDSFHFCGGNTSFDSFAAEAPVVTLPGEFMRGRQTLGLYQRMGFTDLVANSKDEYIEKVLRLANDSHYNEAMRKKLGERVPAIFEDAGVVRALENFFLQVNH